MRKSLTYKVLAAIMAAGSLGLYAATPAAAADDYTVNNDGETLNDEYNNIYGNGYSFTITGGTIYGNVFGVGDEYYDKDASGGNVTLNNKSYAHIVYGGYSSNRDVIGNHVTFNNSSAYNVYGGYSNTRDVSGNHVTFNNSSAYNVYGGYSNTRDVSGNHVTFNNSSADTVYGALSDNGNVSGNHVTFNNSSAYIVCGARSNNGTVSDNHVTLNNSSASFVYGGYSSTRDANENHVTINGGTFEGGTTISTIGIFGAYSYEGTDITLNDNNVTISNAIIKTNVYGGFYMGDSSAEIKNNTITIKENTDISEAKLYGYKAYNTASDIIAENNALIIDGWSGKTNTVQNFNDIAFKNISWQNDGTVLTITVGSADDLENTNIKTIHIAGGSNINVGDKMTLIKSENSFDHGLTEGNVTDTFTAGVAREGLGSTTIDNGNVTFNINSIKLSSQAVSAAQTRAASAAFVNQGTDLISDSLDTISRDDNYGVKTFAAVHGNRSKYDVADDIKINGWSTIVGVGNADKFDNGSELSWGVFYENGSGNYRTYNSFNNEFFRGDGSMVYNGGGIAARYENKNGIYTEGSLRAGMLKNELDNAMRNVNGSYGYETESAYYGAHIGVGKIISLSDSSDLDIYGKFFHTYTEGDSVTIAGDKFDFDSITSDRLRVGARITSNKENKFSTYYGLAYEYEFNGDAVMTAQGLRADTQSLQGSSVMAEVGFNYQPTPDSPWSFDLNMRGYAGERQGGSFNVQATYTF